MNNSVQRRDSQIKINWTLDMVKDVTGDDKSRNIFPVKMNSTTSSSLKRGSTNASPASWLVTSSILDIYPSKQVLIDSNSSEQSKTAFKNETDLVTSGTRESVGRICDRLLNVE